MHIIFPIEIKVKPINGYKIDNLSPGEEKAFIFKIIPLTVGKTIIDGAFIDFTNEKYERIKVPLERFALQEAFENSSLPVKTEPKPLTEKEVLKIRKIHEDKKYIYTILSSKEMTLAEYVELSKRLHYETAGFTLKGVDTETVYMHVMEECKGLYTVSSGWNPENATMMFSAQSYEGETYLLTVVIKMKGEACDVAFRLYSSKEKDLKKMLERIAEVINYTIIIMSMAKEIEKIEVKEVINIIDSVVQRSKLGTDATSQQVADKKIEIKDSVVQRTET
ncbi:MAG: hypothetical protein GXO64_05160 [Candidatus Micrarchaeota archaeon]|nr:hypothetical protein [Candidatus Micrarchaeota archaeon]